MSSHTQPRTSTSSDVAARFNAGDLIASKYKLLELAGRGAFGAVWVAEHVTLGKRVALKLFAHDASSEQGQERLVSEARAAARLKHPGIVNVFDVGETSAGVPFLVMELLDGENLAQYERRVGKRSPIDAARLMLPIAEALSLAHTHGIIHRDLKPANLFVARGESGRKRMVIVDFGLAQNREGKGKITLEGTILGSPHYMSPEQIQALPADARSDIWSFCVVLHELVAGSCPFIETSEYLLLRAIVELEPRPLPEGTAPAFSAIVARGLAKNPDERWPSIAALGRELAGWLLEKGVTDDVTATSLRAAWLAPGSLSSYPPARSTNRPTDDQTIEVAPPSEEMDDPNADELSWNVPGEPEQERPNVQDDTSVPLFRPSQAPTRATLPGSVSPDVAALDKIVRGKLIVPRAVESPKAPPPAKPPKPVEPVVVELDVEPDPPSLRPPPQVVEPEPPIVGRPPAGIASPPMPAPWRRAKTVQIVRPTPARNVLLAAGVALLIVAITLALVLNRSRDEVAPVVPIAPVAVAATAGTTTTAVTMMDTETPLATTATPPNPSRVVVPTTRPNGAAIPSQPEVPPAVSLNRPSGAVPRADRDPTAGESTTKPRGPQPPVAAPGKKGSDEDLGF